MESNQKQWANSANVRRALEKRGMSSPLAARLADALLPRLTGLAEKEAQALIEGAEVSCRVSGEVAFEKPRVDASGLENLFCDLAHEIRKIDEGVRLLASYAVQIRRRLDGREDEVLH